MAPKRNVKESSKGSVDQDLASTFKPIKIQPLKDSAEDSVTTKPEDPVTSKDMEAYREQFATIMLVINQRVDQIEASTKAMLAKVEQTNETNIKAIFFDDVEKLVVKNLKAKGNDVKFLAEFYASVMDIVIKSISLRESAKESLQNLE